MASYEVISLLEDIKDLLSSINDKLDDIRGHGIYSIEDVVDKLNDIETSIDALDD